MSINHKIDLKGQQGRQETLKYLQAAAGGICEVDPEIDLQEPCTTIITTFQESLENKFSNETNL